MNAVGTKVCVIFYESLSGSPAKRFKDHADPLSLMIVRIKNSEMVIFQVRTTR